MALNPTTMANDVVDAIKAINGDVDPTNDALMRQYWTAICAAIIARIQADAVVNSGVTVASVTLVTPGVGVSGPGAGTAVGNIS